MLQPVGGNLYVMSEVTGHRPDQGLPGGGHYPDHELPTIPGVPDNTLPTTPPPQVPQDMVLVLVRTADGKWHWATVPAVSPPTTLPEPPPTAQPK
jgi:hypothetical protein